MYEMSNRMKAQTIKDLQRNLVPSVSHLTAPWEMRDPGNEVGFTVILIFENSFKLNSAGQCNFERNFKSLVVRILNCTLIHTISYTKVSAILFQIHYGS